MVRSILNSSLVKFLIFYQLQNTVVYPLILPSRITPSEIQKIVIKRALLCQLCVQYFIEFHVNFASDTWISQEVFTCKEDNTKYWRKIHPNYVWVLFFFNIHMKNVMNFLSPLQSFIIFRFKNFSCKLQVRKKQTRNDEYNDFLKQNREKEKHKYDKQKYGESVSQVCYKFCTPQGLLAVLHGLGGRESLIRVGYRTSSPQWYS